jgi:Holliday junction resolvase-like predicted endonuclease
MQQAESNNIPVTFTDMVVTVHLKGWQRMWWQYAQNSVLADVRRRLKKTSWRYLKQRL